MILVSTSGFSYDDWTGPFYPPGLRKQEQLSFFARWFPAVELNYSFYSFPGEKGILGHLRNAPGMRFALKGHKCLTHERSYGTREIDIYRAAMNTLRQGDALIAMLLQFPYSFHASEANFAWVAHLLDDFAGWPLAIEFRHAQWKNKRTWDFFRERAVTLVTTDAPALDGLYRGGWEAIGPFGYVRLHGRNAARWWEHEEGWQRYDYLYTQAEIAGMARAVAQLAAPAAGDDAVRSSRDVYVFFNNHWQAQGAINALQLAMELGLDLPDDLPEGVRLKLGDGGAGRT
jgi:uncharacterized protein YecE (DUF72 family)